MKTKRFAILTAAIAFTIMAATPGQAVATKGAQVIFTNQTSPFASLRTHRQGKGITAVWSVATPDGIVGFTVQRTYEDPTDTYAYWEDLATVPYNPTRSFTYTDKEVFPGTISYRVMAVMVDGTTAFSDVSQTRIVSRK
jgi:hypothetical protein